MANDLVVHSGEIIESMPVLTLDQARDRHRQLVGYVNDLMAEGRDYGRVPGSDKPTLLKPGAEKLCTLFGLAPRFAVAEKVTDWTGAEHAGEPFFFFSYRCQLWKGEHLVAEGDASCNSWESKYRFRKASRKCPQCGHESIIRGKEEYGGGYTCWKKKGGCGANFPTGDQRIESQAEGRVRNTEVFDQVNTVQKMAIKRALIGAVLIAVNASEFFTQDLDDFDHGNGHDEPPVQQTKPAKKQDAVPEAKQATKTNGSAAKQATALPQTGSELLERLHAKDREMAAAKQIKSGELVQYVREEGIAYGFPDDISTWNRIQIEGGSECAKDFIKRKKMGFISFRDQDKLQKEIDRRDVAKETILEAYEVSDFGHITDNQLADVMTKLKQSKLKVQAEAEAAG